jgi:prepilin-type N-terminal cleavage/methylation domain-containing protein
MSINRARRESGFSLVELIVAMAIMLLISGAAVTALLKMTSTQATIWNRTQMHSGIRGATEVLQQEVGQAGRITLGATAVSTNGNTSACTTPPGGPTCTTFMPVTTASGMFIGERLVVDTNPAQETVQITAIDTTLNRLTVRPVSSSGKIAAHGNGVPVQVLGAFSAGVVPPATSPSAYAPSGPTMTFANGSTGDTLKLFGDINADGNMVYVEYRCDIPASPSTAPGNLTRNVMPWNQTAASAAATASQILLSNITRNPDDSPCFTYQLNRVDTTYFVTDVAITLTVQTQLIDPVTKQFQKETKALLNVSPRNVFNAWQLASLGIMERVQPTPATITNLLQ